MGNVIFSAPIQDTQLKLFVMIKTSMAGGLLFSMYLAIFILILDFNKCSLNLSVFLFSLCFGTYGVVILISKQLAYFY